MDSLGHSIFPTFFGVENYVASLPRIKYAIASLVVDHLILTVTVSLEDKKLRTKRLVYLFLKLEVTF